MVLQCQGQGLEALYNQKKEEDGRDPEEEGEAKSPGGEEEDP